jgi:D-amino peptidase
MAMRVAIVADMEGVSGITDPHEIFAFARPYWRTGRRSMTSDVSSAARGLLRAGATEVIVVDGHASGNEGHNILSETLPSGARLEQWSGADIAASEVDAVLQVGVHARAGVDAFISDTHVPGLRLRVDDDLVGESHTTTWGADRPLLGIVGNDAHARTVGRGFDEIPYLVVQRTNSLAQAQPAFREPGEAEEAIEDFAAEALRAGGAHIPAPTDFLLEASFPPGEQQAADATAAGWQQRAPKRSSPSNRVSGVRPANW